MTLLVFLPFAAALFSLLLAFASLLRKKPSPAAWCFFAGMAALGIDSLFTGLSLRATEPTEVIDWLTRAFFIKCIIPAIWLAFGLTYSRGNYRESMGRWKALLALVGLIPLIPSLAFREQLFQVVSVDISSGVWGLQFGAMGRIVNVILLIALVLVLMNLEQTFRSAVGTMRWRIKFVVLGLTIIFGARLYVRSQGILFSAPDSDLWAVESGALLIGCLFLVMAYLRTGLTEIDVYPSAAVMRSSLTVLLVGGYLFIVGVMAQVVRRFGGEEVFQFQSFVVLLGLAGLALLLLSDRARQRIRTFVARHFRRAQHDSLQIWTLFSRRLAAVTDQAGLSAVSARSIAETFDVLSVTVWLLDQEKEQLIATASTARQPREATAGNELGAASSAVWAGLGARSLPFDLEEMNEGWAEELRQLNPTTFANGGHRWCVPLRAGEQTLGVVVLADRISGTIYTVEELELLACLGDQMTSVFLNLRLASQVAEAKELEAFRAMSAFFVHDLKNAAASLNLMLKNLPVHFNDPAFREDALRGVGNTARRIDEMIASLAALRERPTLTLAREDLNQLVSEALDRVNHMPNLEVTRELQQPLPSILGDREQIQSVVTNLVINARDALGSDGRIRVRTEQRGERVLLSVSDNGCGMSQAFLRESLFRPFQSTKKKGLGIGLFQTRAIVHAHGGGIQVESDVGRGTTFRVSFPVNDEHR